MHCETVRIVAEASSDNPTGHIVINKDDFDADKHELFDAPAENNAPASKAPRKSKPAE